MTRLVKTILIEVTKRYVQTKQNYNTLSKQNVDMYVPVFLLPPMRGMRKPRLRFTDGSGYEK